MTIQVVPPKGSCQKKTVSFLGDLSQICLTTHLPPTPGFLWDLRVRKVKFGSKRAIFGVIWGGLEGFGPCLGISHPTHPHLGEISQKKTIFFFGSPPYKKINLWHRLVNMLLLLRHLSEVPASVMAIQVFDHQQIQQRIWITVSWCRWSRPPWRE